jgi:isocitrate dehydrogenase
MSKPIIYTLTDEAPMLATYSLLPIVQAFAASAQFSVETRDISLSGRILAQFSDHLDAKQQHSDDLKELGELAKSNDANIIKLPNISASIPQLKAAIKELQSQGFKVPDYPDQPANDQEAHIKARYAKVLGSAVNPVLREGNSDRRVANAVKRYARKHPHSMGAWDATRRGAVASMSSGDFYGNEQAARIEKATHVSIVFEAKNGEVKTLKDGIVVKDGELISATFMSVAALKAFYRQTLTRAQSERLLWSLHLKATMMKVSDPILFGHAVKEFFAPVFEKHGALLASVKANPNNGWGDVLAKLAQLEPSQRAAIERDIAAVMESRPSIAMVDSDKGITNLHVPSDVIIDASMPAAIRSSGQMWGADGKTHDMLAVIPDRCYAGIYQVVMDDCRQHGAFDVATMGTVPNVGLMAQAAEEYGSHDKTFELPSAGVVKVVDVNGAVLTSHTVDAGDVFRMCQTKAVAISDWVKLAVERSRLTNTPALFWLDSQRAYDRLLAGVVREELSRHSTLGLDLRILSPADAIAESLKRIRAGQDTISVTGNVLRDYLTDLFPILELGTSAKMLSIVPLLAGGGLYETGAGGSAPKHVQQFLEEGYLRWDSLGEFLAIQVSIEDLARKTNNARAAVLAKALDTANAEFLDQDKSPARKVGGIDNRGSHFYLALYWAKAVASQTDDVDLAKRFKPLSDGLHAAEATIVAELLGAQGKPVDIGGYYHPDLTRCDEAMRPSQTFNRLLREWLKA